MSDPTAPAEGSADVPAAEPGPLHGLLVVDASTILAGPLCAQLLGDYGADVIKIEHPVAGDGMRGHGHTKDGHSLWWKEISRNKRTVGLSLSVPRGAKIFRSLIARADVLVENFRPGTLERWGLGPEELHRVNPGLVIVRITGFGQTGPYAGRAGFGTLAEAMSGFAHLTGADDGPPTLPAFGLADSLCGIAASSAAAMALFARERDPHRRGQVVDMSLLEPLMAAVGPHRRSTTNSAWWSGGTATAPPTTRRATPISPPTATGSRCPPAPRSSPSACCASSATRRSSSSRGSPPGRPGRPCRPP